MSDIDTDYTDEIVCPYCGYKFMDSWEVGVGYEDGDTECDKCDGPFRWSRHISITYSTKKAES